MRRDGLAGQADYAQDPIGVVTFALIVAGITYAAFATDPVAACHPDEMASRATTTRVAGGKCDGDGINRQPFA